MRNRWAEMIFAGVLAAAALAAPLAWAQPRRASALVPAGPSAPRGSDKTHRPREFPGKLPIRELNEDEAILHALNKLGFGPRPGQVEQIKQSGLENWIQAQLHPENNSRSGGRRAARAIARAVAEQPRNCSTSILRKMSRPSDSA